MDKKGPNNNNAKPISAESQQGGEALSKQILHNMGKSYTSEEPSRFMANLGESLHPSENPSANPETELRAPALQLLERLSNDFFRYCFEFSKVTAGSEVTADCTRPMAPKESTQALSGESLILLESTLRIANWTMILQAQERRLKVFIVPQEYLGGFHARQSYYNPFLEMLASIHNGQTVWLLDELRLSPEILGKLSKQLFSALVKVNAGELTPNERFRIEMSASQSISRLLPDQSEKLALHNLPSMKAFTGEADAKANGQEDNRPSLRSSSSLELEANKNAVIAACQALMQSLDNELGRLNRLEREAFRLEDMKTVEQALSRSGQLRNLLEQLKAATDTWQRLQSPKTELKR